VKGLNQDWVESKLSHQIESDLFSADLPTSLLFADAVVSCHSGIFCRRALR